MLNKTETFPGIIVRTVQQGVREETRKSTKNISEGGKHFPGENEMGT